MPADTGYTTSLHLFLYWLKLTIQESHQKRFRFFSCFCRHEMMKVLFMDNMILKLTLPCRHSSNHLSLRRIAWSIQPKCQQDKFQDQVVFQENLHHFKVTMFVVYLTQFSINIQFSIRSCMYNIKFTSDSGTIALTHFQ